MRHRLEAICWPVACRLIKFLALCLFLGGVSLEAAVLPAGFTETQYGGTLAPGNPTAMAFSPDGRLFVCLQAGQLRVIENGTLLPTPFVTVTTVTNVNTERGLLGVTFDPNFASNNFVYVYYTVPTAPIHNRLSRFTANGNVAAAGSETIILELETLGPTNHNGGAIHFGPDGKLYVAVGENANAANAQSLSNRLGKTATDQRGRNYSFRQSDQLSGNCRDSYGPQPRDLGCRIAESLHLCLPARNGPLVHQ